MAIVERIYQMDGRVGPSLKRWGCKIRIEEDIVGFAPDGRGANTEGTGMELINIHIPSTANRDRGWGRPRGVVIVWTGEPPEGYEPDGKIFVPVLRVERQSRYQIGIEGTFRGSGFKIVSKLPEVVRG